MSYVGGPSSLLPGQYIPFPEGTMCDNHPTVPACARIVGEADSMGVEAADLCRECVNNAQAKEKEEQACEMCGNYAILSPSRDPEEGSSGRVYYWCASCRASVQRSFDEDRSPSDNTPDDYYVPLDHDNI